MTEPKMAPWRASRKSKQSGNITIRDALGKVVGYAVGGLAQWGMTGMESRANARLMAGAPILLKAAKVVDFWETYDGPAGSSTILIPKEALRSLRAAIKTCEME